MPPFPAFTPNPRIDLRGPDATIGGPIEPDDPFPLSLFRNSNEPMAVSSGVDLRVTRNLDLLVALKQVVGDFAKREEQLTRGLLAKRGAANRKHRDGMDKVESRLAVQLAETETHFKSEEDRVNEIFANRRGRIEQLGAVGLRTLPRRAEAAKGRWMGELQMRRFHAERNRDAGTKAAGATAAEFSAQLAAQQGSLAKLEQHARKFFRGYGSLIKMLHGTSAPAEAGGADPAEIIHALSGKIAQADAQLAGFRKLALPRCFSEIPPIALVLIVVVAGGVLALVLGGGSGALGVAGAVVVALIAVIFGIHHAGFAQAKMPAGGVALTIAEARNLHAQCEAAAQRAHADDQQRVAEEYERASDAIQKQWERADDIESEFEAKGRARFALNVPRALQRNRNMLVPRLNRIERERAERLAQFQADAGARTQTIAATYASESAELTATEEAEWGALQSEWTREITTLYSAIDEMNAATAADFPEWSPALVESWRPPVHFVSATKFASLNLSLVQRHDANPKDIARLALPGSPRVSIPLALTFPDRASLLFETSESGGTAVIGALENVILRLLATTPPGKLAFTIIDPVGLGQNFAGLMHLGDYEESLINRRIWTQRDQIEERLGELSEHIEKVIQMYLRNEYTTITEYNEQAGSIAEKYHFLVVADFPANFSETAVKRLQSIALSGPRCGIFTLIHWDQRHQMPDGFVADELRKNSVCIRREGEQFVLHKKQLEAGGTLVLDPPPEPGLAVELVHKIGKASIDSNRVEVPFAQITPPKEERWTLDTTTELRIPIGRTGATKHQYLAIGKGTRQHALFAGKTGSGKSTLFHVIITNLALACSPEQVEFYLIDFKKGVEFKCYATKRLPHARVVAIESDREFALSVLQRVDAELKRRGDMFRALGVQDIAGYKRAGGTEPMPRSLLLIDEFQEFFVEDDSVAQSASLLFDRIVRQGRAFGIHVLLGSQTLGGAYSLARATLGQMVIRVALQCSEADAYLIMDDSNPAPRLLTRPGEGIYNDAAGAIEGNSPFQVVWLPDDERDAWLDEVRALAEQHHIAPSSPIVFEGNAPADIRENAPLESALRHPPSAIPTAPRAWLGAPNSIKGPTEAVFQRQSGNHLLIVGQREDAALTMLGLALLALAAQHPRSTARFIFLLNAAPGTSDSDFIEKIIAASGHEITLARAHDIPAIMNEIAADQKARSTGTEPALFLFIHGLHKFKKLRHEDDFSFSSSSEGEGNPGAQLTDIITEGSALGVHILTSIDTLNNVNRAMSRKALSEFEMRVVFQMSANDSASLIDNPKASALGLHRAIFYNEHEGSLETFRPYAMPDAEWFSRKV